MAACPLAKGRPPSSGLASARLTARKTTAASRVAAVRAGRAGPSAGTIVQRVFSQRVVAVAVVVCFAQTSPTKGFNRLVNQFFH
jgi:hypothetical protein